MSIIVKALISGIICGAVFTKIKLPLPAPPTISGIAGIGGIYLGYILMKFLKF